MIPSESVEKPAPVLRSVTLAVRGALSAPELGLLPAPAAAVLVGFSGGADSSALALALRRLGIPLVLAHLDHGLRPESAAEAAPDGPVRQFAARLGVPCVVERADVAGLAASRRIGLEEAGRAARADFLERARKASGCAWIALGHQADDLLEDVLLRLTRGVGWPALAGMRGVDPARRLIRPLLHLSRVELEAFLTAAGQTWLNDPSNAEDAFRRNRLRHHVVPLLLRENPALREATGRLWEMARADEAFWAAYLAPALDQIRRAEGRVSLSEAVIRPLPRAARLRLLAHLLREAAQGRGGQARADTLFRLDDALMARERPRRFQFPGGLACLLEKGNVLFFTEKSAEHVS